MAYADFWTILWQIFLLPKTRIRAELIYRAHVNAEEPMTPEEVAVDYGLPLAAVAEAIEKATLGKMDPKEMLDEAAEKSNKLLQTAEKNRDQ